MDLLPSPCRGFLTSLSRLRGIFYCCLVCFRFIQGLFSSILLSFELICFFRCRYDSEQDTWEVLSPLLSARADHTMLSHHGNLYVCGGWLEDDVTGNRVSLLVARKSMVLYRYYRMYSMALVRQKIFPDLG